MTEWTTADYTHMARAVQLAKSGTYTCDPNPRVGCVLVRDGEVVGEGFHAKAGEGHAEVNALRMAGDKAQGATAYVTLEPCSHYGRTPPCAEGLIKAGVARVVAAMVDPNPQVAGRGLAMLEEAGIETAYGLLEPQARALNPGFLKRMEQQRPFVRLKLAMSLDGRTAMRSGESQWITGPAARTQVQRLRARSSAVITGVESILHDDSALTLREAELKLTEGALATERQPLRIILDSQLRTPLTAKILSQPGRTIIVTACDEAQRVKALTEAGAEVRFTDSLEGERIALEPLLDWLAGEEECNEVLVETGATLAGAFISAGLVDELVVFMAPVLLGSDARPLLEMPLTEMAQRRHLELVEQRRVGADQMFVFHPQRGEAV